MGSPRLVGICIINCFLNLRFGLPPRLTTSSNTGLPLNTAIWKKSWSCWQGRGGVVTCVGIKYLK